MDFRLKDSGQIITKDDLRRKYWNVSLPPTWDNDTLAFLNVDPIFAAPQPPNTDPLKTVRRNGVVQDAKGHWVENWELVDIFQDITNADGTVTTKAQQEQEFLNKRNNDQWTVVRASRDSLLKQTDWMSSKASDTGVQMSQEWLDYRQALRDITTQPDPFNITWPVAPQP